MCSVCLCHLLFFLVFVTNVLGNFPTDKYLCFSVVQCIVMIHQPPSNICNEVTHDFRPVGGGRRWRNRNPLSILKPASPLWPKSNSPIPWLPSTLSLITPPCTFALAPQKYVVLTNIFTFGHNDIHVRRKKWQFHWVSFPWTRAKNLFKGHEGEKVRVGKTE